MKKLLLIAAASATILSSTLSFADCAMDTTQSKNENQWYIKAGAGASIFNKAKIDGLKLKSNTAFIGEIGAGYYIMDNFRADVTLGMVSNAQFKLKTPDEEVREIRNPNNGDVYNISTKLNSLKVKPSITSLLFNGSVDVVDVDMFKIFATGGVGAALVKEKITSSTITKVTGNGINEEETINESFSTKKNNYNFAWQAGIGASAEVAPGVKAELVYSWRDYGKAKAKKDGAKSNIRYKGNNVMAGVRFDI
ncbi:acyloxyacyl hydrolase [Rickettsia endosymbiont of Halotydeus destructor]|uniref:acyloxyacyl hydrolase n=1 Tax=Rickettsia endosymbiont of Halotydeus destructor TaxID=2996754 RepID=UPI003BAEB727